MPRVNYGPISKKRAKRLLEALLAYVKGDLEDVNGISLSYKWQDETTKQPKLVIETKLRVLECLTEKDRHEGKLTKPQIRQALNDHLKDFLHILDDTRAKTQGKEDWHFTLKLWSKDKEKNLEQFEIEWEGKRPEKSKQQEETLRETVVETFQATSLPKDEGINWQEICRQNLAEQKKFTTKELQRYGAELQLDEIYVPLAIVERKPPKPPSRNQQEEKEEERLIPITEERFFEEVLRQGKSDISQGRKIAIIGEPGSGKTTRLQKIADWILEQDLGFPIFIELAYLENQDICQYLENKWLPKRKGGVKRSDLEPQISRAWLLLDGVDEMSHTQKMQELAKDLSSSWVQAARVVVTCRVNVWEADKNAFSGFDVFRNLEFNPEQVTDYIRRWFAGIGDAATGESLEVALAQSENSRLKELIQNPLRLWMLCQIWQPEGGLPETQAGLYGQFVDWVYRWKADEELDQREAIDTALARLALAAMEQKDEVLRLRLRESWVLQVLGSRPIFQAVMKLGWLNRVERLPEAICVFYHATFQEYFAALAVDDWDYFLPRNHVNFPVAGKEYRIFEPQWKQVILLWLGRGDVAHEEKEGFIQKLIDFQDGCRGAFYTDQSYFIAALAFREFKQCLQANKIVNQIVKWGFGYFDKNRQTWQIFLSSLEQDARKILIQTNKILATRELLSLMGQPQLPKHQKQTIQLTLEQLGYYDKKVNCAASEIIENNLSNDIIVPHWKDLPSDVLELANFIDSHRNDEIARIAILKLESISCNSFQTILILLRLVKTSIDQDNRWVAVSILIEIVEKNEEASLILAKLLILFDKNQHLNLDYISLENPRYCFFKAATETMLILLNTEDEQIRILSAISLSKIGKGNIEVIGELIEKIKIIYNQKLCKLIIILLGDIGKGSSQVTQALSEIIDSPVDKYIRWLSAESLGKVHPGNTQSTTTLLEFLITTEDEIIQRETPSILEKLTITNQQRALIVGKVSPDNKNSQIHKNRSHNWFKSYTLLWNISQDLAYPDFYRAWHGFTET